ncbi:MAG TPA: SLC13 family permease, partial [Longimicrobiales bacterium]|nr:SLC13 family permease [Longimicrobiales bacterium]
EAIDWNVVFLLGAMMTIVSIMIPTGGFQKIAYTMADMSRGRQFMLIALLGTAVTVLSLLLDNVTTVVIFGPLIVLIAQALKVSPIPFLLSAALLADTGGVATLVGDPPNIMIGSAADIDFNTFFIHMGPIVFVAWIIVLFMQRWIFREELAVKAAEPDLSGGEQLADPHTWYASLGVLGLMVVLFIVHRQLNWEPWVVAVLGLTILMFIGKGIHHIDDYMQQVELSLLMFFASLFVLVGGVEHSQFLEYVGQFILPFVESDLLTATLVLMWGGAIMSAFIDNIPFTAAMIPILLGMDAQGVNVTPLWWGLALGVGLGGNGTHLGSTANVFIVTLSERIAKETGDPSLQITPGVWIRKGTPVMLATLVTASVIMSIWFDFFSRPLP